jgi:hypothetical protein
LKRFAASRSSVLGNSDNPRDPKENSATSKRAGCLGLKDNFLEFEFIIEFIVKFGNILCSTSAIFILIIL